MGLDKIFQEKAEKPEKEKKLEVVSSDESVVDELLAYFYSTKKDCCKTPGDLRDYFEESQKFLQTYRLKKGLISRFNDRIDIQQIIGTEKNDLGIFLSALMQASYQQGSNNFKLKEVNANSFGGCLHGEEGNKINIHAQTINGNYALVFSRDCYLKVGSLNGDCSLVFASGCIANIKLYRGQSFGAFMMGCEVYSPNKKTLKKMWNQRVKARKGNTYKIKK
ncbi:hypothetical protein HY643_02080 [Candidatus Woesearchaeota archaeon]|nr:hypothetical protein [Candidatus Woesearchaeota archaeon]